MVKYASVDHWKTFGRTDRTGIFMVDGSRIYDLDSNFRNDIDAGKPEALAALEPLLKSSRPISFHIESPPKPQNISLNVSSSCNLSCAYCYAGKGRFNGKQTTSMTWPIAQAAVDSLLHGAKREFPVTIGFLGGEPFVNRRLIHRVTNYAIEQARLLEIDVRFSVTTNGTLLKPEDIDLMRDNRFAVTFSIDGGETLHEQQRPGANFRITADAAKELISNPGRAQISARATVVRGEFDLINRFDAIHSIGFTDIGFSPVRMGPPGQRLEDTDWPNYLAAMLKLGKRESDNIADVGKTAFSNLMIALKKIHGGACSPYPCGAGGGYFSVAADGEWYACHRAIGDKQYHMGSSQGLNLENRIDFLRDRHIDSQTHCGSCWARYLCSGTCHHEASARSQNSCDFIRGWLEFCFEAYARLSKDAHELKDVYT